MSEMTLKSIYDGISLALHDAYPDRQIHGGAVRQGLRPGDFNVILVGSGQSKQVGQRWLRTPVLDVIYYPKNTACVPEECSIVASDVMILLDSITTPGGDIVHASNVSAQLTDEVLHISLQYDHFVYLPEDPENMETLTIQEVYFYHEES